MIGNQQVAGSTPATGTKKINNLADWNSKMGRRARGAVLSLSKGIST